MDFIFLSSLVGCALKMITVSYDIACQWSRNFRDRMNQLPLSLRLLPELNINFAVPKYHLTVHSKKCWAPFSLNYRRWVGRTDGEGVERNWASLNGIARCTSMMGAGGRWDTLDDFFNHHNWRKTVNLGKNSMLMSPVLCLQSHFRWLLDAQTDGGHSSGCHP